MLGIPYLSKLANLNCVAYVGDERKNKMINMHTNFTVSSW